ncbi:hypothetical protein LTR54_002144 [Friedmanniomyces endolithicus]|uniref:Uncharacterized protein n=1 Tax=Friedmanniomyces endolithicus TaxID=329885 RepID=A0AAN6JEB4_9PEZI|nr:hypothetical protein LTR82_002377 [Friedmanniomyces endolithicus]KAK1017486.1 hypothetical protein LTR54_002144 [Friedmanniomyces endolithicus]
MSLGLREDEAVLEWNDRLLDAFSNDDSDEPARRQLFAVIKELTQYVKNAAAQVDVEEPRSLTYYLIMIHINIDTGVVGVGEKEGGRSFLDRSHVEGETILGCYDRDCDEQRLNTRAMLVQESARGVFGEQKRLRMFCTAPREIEANDEYSPRGSLPYFAYMTKAVLITRR